jgi:hypothetical protein
MMNHRKQIGRMGRQKKDLGCGGKQFIPHQYCSHTNSFEHFVKFNLEVKLETFEMQFLMFLAF